MAHSRSELDLNDMSGVTIEHGDVVATAARLQADLARLRAESQDIQSKIDRLLLQMDETLRRSYDARERARKAMCRVASLYRAGIS